MRLARAIAWLPLLLAPSAEAATVLVTGFAYDLPGSAADDAVELLNAGPETVAFEEIEVRDGEGTWRLPTGAWGPGTRIWVAGNGTAFEAAARRPADFAESGPATSGVVAGPGPRLAKDGDEVLVYRAGELVDAVAYGSSEYTGPGWIGEPVPTPGGDFLRWIPRRGTNDSDSAADWTGLRRTYLGQTVHGPVRAWSVEALAYAAPDHSRDAFLDFVGRTERSLWLNVYDFREPGLATVIAEHAAARPGFDLRVLVDSAPVGLSADERALRNAVLRHLAAAGGQVRVLEHERYAFDHAKYAVADGRWILVQSENLVPGGVPYDRTQGNHGWGVVVESSELAEVFSGLFEADFALDPFGARELGPAEEFVVPLPVVPTDIRGPSRVGTRKVTGLWATTFFAPDSTLGDDDLVLAGIRGAREEILVEQLNLPASWRDASGVDHPNAYLEALIQASARGVHVRILLDGTFVDPLDERRDNADTVAWLRTAAPAVEARVWDAEDAPLLHVKGVVVDRRSALVGSMNWNLNSVAQNREVSFWLDAPGLAEFYAHVFDVDWVESETQSTTPAAALATVITGLLFAAAMRRRRAP